MFNSPLSYLIDVIVITKCSINPVSPNSVKIVLKERLNNYLTISSFNIISVIWTVPVF